MESKGNKKYQINASSFTIQNIYLLSGKLYKINFKLTFTEAVYLSSSGKNSFCFLSLKKNSHPIIEGVPKINNNLYKVS